MPTDFYWKEGTAKEENNFFRINWLKENEDERKRRIEVDC